jgi:predicted RNase H-like nuclease
MSIFPAPGAAADSSRRADVQPRRAGIIQRRSGEVRRRTTVYFDPQLAMQLKLHCATLGIEMSDFVDAAVRAQLDQRPSSGSAPSDQTGMRE